ncbi:MAG: protoheme IX farnesyltransferase [Pelagibacteraceae bacterium]|nr:protoheme IX farnesyltransferase [Pelagibacteraceae bacterium]
MIHSTVKSKNFKANANFSLSSFFNLMKPRVMSLVLFTSMVGLLIAPEKVSFTVSIISLFAVALGAGAAGALNMWYESDLDALMTRTCLRPIPTGRVQKNQALWFGIILSIISISLLYFTANLVSSILLAVTIGFYFFIYTIWLKRRTPQNIVIGGAAGALPPMIGWAIATNSISAESIILFLIIFIWTPSHFWALSLYKSSDYKKAKIPMLPITSGIQTTKLNILIYSLLMAPVVALPYFFNFGGLFYLTLSSLMTSYYVYLCATLFKEKNNKNSNIIARKIFIYSIFYLFFIFVLILADNIIQY